MSDSGDTETEGSTANLAERGEKSDSKKKILRLLTVMAYVSSVSGAAFMLSVYYLFLWEPKVAEHHLRADPNSHQALALQGHHAVVDPRGPPRDYWPLSPHEAHSPYRPPGTPEAFPMGSYRPPGSVAGAPPTGYQRPYQDLPPVWMHAPPPPPRPHSLSQVRADAPGLLDRIAALARASPGPDSTPVTSTPPPATAPETRAPVTLHRRRPILPAAAPEATDTDPPSRGQDTPTATPSSAMPFTPTPSSEPMTSPRPTPTQRALSTTASAAPPRTSEGPSYRTPRPRPTTSPRPTDAVTSPGPTAAAAARAGDNLTAASAPATLPDALLVAVTAAAVVEAAVTE